MIRDDRARVPFALVGILLLLGSATVTVTLQPAQPLAESSVDVAMERGTAETTSALRASVREASNEAAREPVLSRANTTAGRVLNTSQPFRDALRLRIYLRARSRLDALEVESGDVSATSAVPPTPNASALRAAKRRVHLDTVTDNGTALRVRIENVTTTAHRGNRTVGRRERAVSVVVRTPVLALHERVERFDARLNAGLDSPGLGQRLTGYAYGLTWARGYAQYGGVPIENVLGSGHLGVLTNGAVLSEQRAVFGRSDAAARTAFGRAMTGLVVSELSTLAVQGSALPSNFPVSGPAVPDPNAALSAPTGDTSGPSPGDEMSVSVSGTADRALTSVAAPANLSSVLRDAYTADARVTARIRARDGSTPEWPGPPPGGRWNLEHCQFESAVAGTESADRSPQVPTPGDWHALAAYARTVEQEQTRSCDWQDGNDSATTTNTATIEYETDVGALGRHIDTGVAPSRPFESVHEETSNGPYPDTDPNFAAVRERVVGRLVNARGGPGTLAARRVRGELNTSAVSVVGRRPPGLDNWVRRDLAALAATVRNVSTTVSRGRVGTLETNPAGRLAAELDSRRAAFVDAPERYVSVAQRARVAARRAYVETVIARLESRGAAHRNRRSALDGVLGNLNAGSVELLSRALDSRRSGVPRQRPTTGDGITVTGVHGSPAYLTTSAVSGDRVESLEATETVHPLAARNVNVFANPAGDVTDALLGGSGGNEVSFRAAARTLAAAETAARVPTANETRAQVLDQRRSALCDAVAAKFEYVKGVATAVLAANGVGDDTDERMSAVATAFDRWETTGARALALTNGSAAAAIAATAPTANETRQTLLEARLRSRLDTVVGAPAVQVSSGPVSETATVVRGLVREELRAQTERAIGRGVNRTVSRIGDRLSRSVNRVPAGLPMVPIGTPWWATVNVWYVEVRGGYDRFAVSAQSGSADRPGGSLTYVRDGETVTLDYDGDGHVQRFGRADRVAFSSRTAVAIAVPPGPQGVGDKNGNVDERSSGWDAWAELPSETRRVPWADRE